jgi:nucleoside-diphosphate-sugar epimerase
MLKVLVTGHKGYIGSVLTPMLLERGMHVSGVDAGYFDSCTLVPDRATVPELKCDIRDLAAGDLRGFDAIVHLAALSNDPLGDLNSTWTDEINFCASVRLAALAKEAGVRRFLFSSSCIMYGLSTVAAADESTALTPQTPYAVSKVKAEQGISQLADATFSPVLLRNGTVYGVSPRMRFDTVFNNLLGSGFTSGHVVVLSNGLPWRPVIHIEDVSRAFIAILEAPIEVVHNQAFNVGSDRLNHQIFELAEAVVKVVPGCDAQYLSRADADQRTYKASFEKITRLVPQFAVQWDIASAAASMHRDFLDIGLTRDMFVDPRFTRVSWIKKLLAEYRLNPNLRWRPLESAA